MLSQSDVWKLQIVGLIFHHIFADTVFHCYFTTRVVHGMEQYSMPYADWAKRVVFIVGNGLRADLLFMKNGFVDIAGSPDIVAPYLRSIVETRGAWGISHTRVPSETRPGHVAFISGMNEDVSEVTKGWRQVGIDFDSVFNQSSTTFAIGSPTVLASFVPGAPPGKIQIWKFDPELEDYTKDATQRDKWFFETLQAILRNSTAHEHLDTRLRADKTVLFLHLPGLDITGHSLIAHFQRCSKLFSGRLLCTDALWEKEYMMNIQTVDDIVEKTENLFRQFYGDDDTAFVLTADHGMTPIGNHGDGHPDSTCTPLIVWGKGVRGSLPDSTPSSHDAYSKQFGLSHLLRRDVEQADIALLLSALIGTKWPTNAMGMLPDVDPTKPGYLLPNQGNRYMAQAALVNAQSQRSRFYRPYFTVEELGQTQLSAIETLIDVGDHYQARLHAMVLISAADENRYDAPVILGIVVSAYIGWIALCAATVLLPAVWRPYFVSTTVLAALWSYFASQDSPLEYYAYAIFLCYFWAKAWPWCSSRLWQLSEYPYDTFMVIGTIAATQTMVFAYTYRFAEDRGGSTCGAVAMIVIGYMGTRMLKMLGKPGICGLASSTVLVYLIVGSLRAKRGVPPILRTPGWIILLLSVRLMISYSSVQRCFHSSCGSAEATQVHAFFLGVGMWFIRVAVSVEGVFYVAFALMLYLLVEVEYVWHRDQPLGSESKVKDEEGCVTYQLKGEDLGIALFFLLFMQIAFFGPGNSFYLDLVYRLISRYNPYLLIVLLMLKMFAPFLILALTFSVLHARLSLPPFNLFVSVLVLSDGKLL
ncbi:Phosphatidylinositolglycan class N-domain-containing protein [Dichomitus squalens]|uniref:GPI ethanolamine phosphate transferase 1 n=1 Tax=Dichomitus squalens TaxID=114155 RepID=A0A4Q9MB78_9APHY|nr:Phosphatidylinositolglycan class N-domain-containing protein [Dichomitus squalens]